GEVVGPCSGRGGWEPVATEGIPSRILCAGTRPRLAIPLASWSQAIDGDLVYACKPRLTSAGLGYWKRLAANRPLLLDIDDWEVGFFLRSGFWGTVGRAVNLGNPAGLPWTWLCERLTRLADGITVASRFLQQRFGGVLVPHVRDTDAWKPGAGNAAEARRRLGVGNERLVLFLGTLRDYKGVDDLAAAVASLGRSDVVLAGVGGDPG